MRLIDADNFMDEIERKTSAIERYSPKDIVWMIKHEPSVDAVEVVRCKECKWWKTNYSWSGNEHKICVKEAYEPFRNAEDFCSRGERREDD